MLASSLARSCPRRERPNCRVRRHAETEPRPPNRPVRCRRRFQVSCLILSGQGPALVNWLMTLFSCVSPRNHVKTTQGTKTLQLLKSFLIERRTIRHASMPISKSLRNFCRNLHWWRGPRPGRRVLAVWQLVHLSPFIHAQAIRLVWRDSSQVFSHAQMRSSTKPHPKATSTVWSDKSRRFQISSSHCRVRSLAWVVSVKETEGTGLERFHWPSTRSTCSPDRF